MQACPYRNIPVQRKCFNYQVNGHKTEIEKKKRRRNKNKKERKQKKWKEERRKEKKKARITKASEGYSHTQMFA